MKTSTLVCRVSLGLVWLYEGLVPKILFAHANPAQTQLVADSGVVIGSVEATILGLGIAQAAMGAWLISGWRARTAAVLSTGWLCVLMVLVGWNRPGMLIDPFGALAKDLCLFACAFVVYRSE